MAKLDASIDLHSKAQTRQNEIIALYPSLKNFTANFRKKLSKMNDGIVLADKIVSAERKFYQSMYKNLQSDSNLMAKKNPCKDFVL